MNNAIITILMVIVISVPLFFDNSLYSCFDLSKVSLLYLLVAVASALWCFKIIMSEKIGRFRLPVLGLPVVASLIATGLATIFSVSPYISLVGTHKRYGGLISAVIYALLFFMVVRFVKRRHVDSFVTVIIVTAVIGSVFGIIQKYCPVYTWSTDFGCGGGGRAASTFGHPAFYSAFLIMTVPLVLCRMFDGCNKKTALILYVPVFLILLFAFYQTKTRASFVGLIVSICFLCFVVRKQVFVIKGIRIGGFIAILGIAGICLYMENSLISRFLDDIKGGKLSGTSLERLVIYKTSLKIISDHPVLGIGPDTLGMIYPRYYTDDVAFVNQNRVHNGILDITLSLGFLGLAAYICLFFAWLRMVVSGFLRGPADSHTLLAGLASGTIAYLVQNQFSFGHVPIIMLFWVMLGLSVVLCGGEK